VIVDARLLAPGEPERTAIPARVADPSRPEHHGGERTLQKSPTLA
jgi:hypothetical protein